tara:strand:- start:795 stop:1307 length:513 start_codon:yes stop_codon:yes gene_type:complete
MIQPQLPWDEQRRMTYLRALQILDTPPEERFDRVTRMAQAYFGVPIALLSLVDENRQWFKSCQGLSASETSREVSFCGHTILQSEPLVIPDATEDPRFADNPLVLEGPEIRFYAGWPLGLDGGSALGTLCIIDSKPRDLDPAQLEVLGDLANVMVDLLRLHQVSNALTVS